MRFALVRIDDRLIHGQVVEGWLKHIRVNHIIVANDWVAADPLQRQLLGMAVPEEIKTNILSIDELIQKVKNNSVNGDNILLLLSSPRDALRLVKGGLDIKSINIGVMHYTPGKKEILSRICLNSEDINMFLQLHKHKIALEVRALPQDKPRDLMKYLGSEVGRR